MLNGAYAGGEHLAYVDEEFLVFDRTHWRELSEAELGGTILSYLMAELQRSGRAVRSETRDISATLKMRCAVSSDRWYPRLMAPIINVANGELWIDADWEITLRPHSPASRLRHCLEVAYDPVATCPRFDGALTEIFQRSTSPAAMIALWHEVCGYLLQPVRRQPRILVLRGGGGDGKSALVETFVQLLGHGQVASMPVESLVGSRYVMGDLAGKHLCLDPDMAAGVTLPDGVLKKLSEATTVTAERKWRSPITYTTQAVPVLVTNHVPRLIDRSVGFRRRLVVIPFERRFDEGEVDYGLFPAIHATEMPGVLNRALAGLQRVIRHRWKFDLPEAVSQATDAWWAAATGAVHESVQAPPSARAPIVPVPAASAGSARLVHGMMEPVLVEPETHVSVGVDLAAASKGRMVQVTVSATALEVRVTGATPEPDTKVLALGPR